jgi:phage-related tail protein
MKAIFEFDLPEDQHEYDVMNQAIRMQKAMWDLSEALRSWEKYGHQFSDARDAVVKIREEFYTILNNYEVNIDL